MLFNMPFWAAVKAELLSGAKDKQTLLLPSTLGTRLERKGVVLQAGSNLFTSHIEWYVAFTDARKPVWWQRFLKTGFQHCWAFTYDPETNTWLVFEPTWKNLHIRSIPQHKFSPFIQRASEGGLVYAVPVQQQTIKKSRLFMSCVSEICHLIGVDLFFATPWRLQCELTKMKCKRKFVPNL